jgi:hypothetical protein
MANRKQRAPKGGRQGCRCGRQARRRLDLARRLPCMDHLREEISYAVGVLPLYTSYICDFIVDGIGD